MPGAGHALLDRQRLIRHAPSGPKGILADAITAEFATFSASLGFSTVTPIPIFAHYGDNVRHGLNRDLGFTEADRVETIRRVAEVAALMADAGLIVLVSVISPYRAERQMARELMPEGEFIEVFVDTPIKECRRRDVKGLYAKADAGLLRNFTGVDAPYEPPERPQLRTYNAGSSPQDCAAVISDYILSRQSSVSHVSY